MSATSTAETLPVQDSDQYYQAEIRRMGKEMEGILAEIEESQQRCERLSASTDRNLEAIRVMLEKPTTPLSS